MKLIGGISPVDENDFPYSNRFGGAKHKNILLRENCALAQNNSKTPGYVTLLLASPRQGRGSIIGRQAERGEWTVSMRWKLEASLFCVKGSAHFKRLALLRSVGETPTWMIWFARKAFLGHIRELENVVPRFDQ